VNHLPREVLFFVNSLEEAGLFHSAAAYQFFVNSLEEASFSHIFELLLSKHQDKEAALSKFQKEYINQSKSNISRYDDTPDLFSMKLKFRRRIACGVAPCR
jgi:hypothetical protein